MGKKEKSQKVFILVIVGAFLISSLSLSGLVIWEIVKGSGNSSTNQTAEQSAELQKQLQEQLNKQTKEGKLEGTTLQNFTPIDSVDSLQKVDTVEGTGEEVKPGAEVTAHYTGAVASTGVIFQSSHDSGQPIPFSLNGVIAGWTEGVPGMKVGGTRRLTIPAELAYGPNPPQGSGIPPNAALVFDIELTAVKNK